jgi:hypothetical protein
MTDRASVLRRGVDDLIQTQITTLHQSKPLTESELANFRARSEKIHALFKTADGSSPLPDEPVRERKIAYPHPSI